MTLHKNMAYAPLPEEFFSKLMDKDNITDSWLLMSSPYPVLTILAVYLVIVLGAGKRLMANRKPFHLTSVMRYYNLFQVVQNGAMLSVVLFNGKITRLIIRHSCNIHEEEDNEHWKYVFLICSWLFLLSKITDLLDTIFMVLRKKDSHVTFLHVYHHVAMVFFVWSTLYLSKSYHGVFPAIINTFIHTVMYSYYYLSTFPELKKYLWWKKHLTKLQLGQFVVVLLYISLLYYNGCPMSRYFTLVWIFNVFVILILFINFYVKAYITRLPGSADNASGKKVN